MKKRLKQNNRERRQRRVKAKVFGTAARPRLCVYRSHQHIYAQLVDDDQGKTLALASDRDLKGAAKNKEPARAAGKLVAQKAKDLKIEQAVFDRRGYKYHGKVKALAEGAREGGLKF